MAYAMSSRNSRKLLLAHFPGFIDSSQQGYQMAGLPVDDVMMIGMVLIPSGFLLATFGLMPRLGQLHHNLHGRPIQFHVADGAPLNREHWLLVMVLLVALAVDVMKPATLGFVMPGMSREYGISKQTAGWLALVALTGTTVGSVVWGHAADGKLAEGETWIQEGILGTQFVGRYSRDGDKILPVIAGTLTREIVGIQATSAAAGP